MSFRSALIVAAGTGGHIIPGLAIAKALQSRQWAVQWLGTRHGMEGKLVPDAGLVLNAVDFAGLRGQGAWGLVKGLWQLLGAVLDSVRIIRRVKPDVMVGMGGYVCVPAAWAAKLMRVPLVLMNADADVLLSNRSLASMAQAICCGFDSVSPTAASRLPRAVVTGNAIRAEVAALPVPAQRYAQRSGALNVLVVGGSLGAQVLNDTVPQAIALLPVHQRPNVRHQTGVKQCDTTRETYAQLGVTATVQAFIDDMATAYAWADVVVCRAGAVTVSELCAAGVPALLVPLIVKTTRHQVGNAQTLQTAGAGIHLAQAQLSAATLAQHIGNLDRAQLLTMAQAAKQLGKPNATQTVADIIEKSAA